MALEYLLREIVNKGPVLLVLALCGLVLLYRLASIGSRPKDYPPGPPTLPIIGNLHQIPKTNVHLQYQKWAQQYGPIFSLKLGQSTTIVLADGEVIRDLVDQRGANYADRPKLWVRELFDDSRIIMRGYDDLWRTERKLYHSQLNISVARKYLPYQELETLQMLTQIAEDPANFVQYLGRMTGSMATSIAYGFRLPKATDPLTHEMLENSHGFFQCVVRSAVLDWFPSLKPLVSLIPRHINPWATDALAAYANERKTFQKAYKMGLQSRLPCFTTDIEAAKPSMKLLSDHAAVYIAGIAFEGGADTTRYTLQGLFKAMALFPEAQKKAQAELDEVVGATELPSSKHLGNLKYINCTAKECVRWMPTAINGAIPHATVNDDQYRGYRIPAGATVVLAVWSASHDPKNFDDARTFRPERQNPDTTIYEATNIASPKERGLYGFGAGRRICPGMHVAHNTLMLAIARILWAFNITPAEDEAGNPVTIDRDAMAGGLAAMPAPFKCKITPRSDKRAALILKEWSALSAKCLDEEGNYKESMFDTK